VEQCLKSSRYIYLLCNDHALANTDFEESWGGVRFARPYFEPRGADAFHVEDPTLNRLPVYVKPELLTEEEADASFMNHVEIVGAGR
jgi:hypothetical protein